ncbi:MAG: hypothetical protein LH478_02315 [Chitinophagaceae bacterium]|nr:hypothetical protein [Chitinophagaceae bacterium]
MKTELPKFIQELNESKVPIVIIDPSLEKYRDKILFPEKLARAKELLKNAKLPENKYRS